MSKWLTHPSGQYRRVGNTIHVRYWVTPDITNMYPVPADPRVEELERERDEAKEQADLWRKLAERQDNTALRTELSRVKRERDEWKARAEGGLSSAGRSALTDVRRAARIEHAKYPDEAREFHKSIDALERVGIAAVYEENDSGGKARAVVAEVARVLGVDIDEGPGHRWDPEHLARVVERAKWVAESRDYWESEEASTRRQAEDLLAADDVDELRAVIVSQAREIARLKGEGE